MARRKKNETVGGEKPPPPASAATTSSNNATVVAATPVRKSSRQIARKQSIDALDGKKQNGELLNKSPAATAISKNIQKNSSQIIINEGGGDAPIAPRKRGRPSKQSTMRNIKMNNTKTTNSLDESNTCPIEVEKNLDKIVNDSKKISETDDKNLDIVTEVVVAPSDEVIVSNCHEIDTTEEVIEETIVCEEMEVEIDGNADEINVNSNEYIVQDENVGNEQVIVMEESCFEEEKEDDDNNVVLLIDNKNEAMITNSEEILTENEYEIIEEGVECLSVNDQQDDLVNTENNEVSTNTESYESQQQFMSTFDDVEEQLPASLIENVQSRHNSTEDVVEESDLSMDCSSRDVYDEIKNSEEISNTSTSVNEQLNSQDVADLPDNTEMIVETIVEESAVEVSENHVDNEIDLTGTVLSEKIYNIELDSNDITVETTISENIVEIETETILIQEEEEEVVEVEENSAKLTENSFIELSQNHEDCSRESVEIDSKNYSDELKSNNSESSNDTLLPNNINKTDDSTESMKVQNQIDPDKKNDFRNRSGSTDTTGSENGSNSSGIRRSSRIRSQGLMKQRSRGRGLVTKPIADVTKAMQEREKLELITGQSRLGQSFKKDVVALPDGNCNSPELHSDTQSDKENTNKSVDFIDLNTASTTMTSSLSAMTTPTTSPPPPPPPPPPTVSPSTISSSSVISCDSDAIKPVKVKSRWRRISELEMGGTTGSLPSSTSLTSSNSSFVNSTNDHNSAHGSFSSGDNNESIPSASLCPDNSIKSSVEMNENKIIDNNVEQDVANDKHEELNNHKLTNIGDKKLDNLNKNKLPIIKEDIYDRELAERLSQFEKIKENLYLSQRYINKETKRMVCDCFLTDEDIERGELGCGDDCLNRLLMIECGSRCIVSNRCTNKRFQKCKYSGCEVFRTEKKGFGLRATSDILPGEFIMEYVGEVLNPKDFRRRAKEYSKDKNKHYYFMALKSDQIIDATAKGNISRFINHSCDPNSETQKWTVNGELRIGFFNRRFISAGEEITFDYHFQRYGKEAQRCYCESANCRGWIGDTPEEEKEKLRKNNKIDNDYFSSSSSVVSSSSSSTMSSPSPSPSPSLSYPSPAPSPSPSVTSTSSATTTKASTSASTSTSTSSAATTTTTRTRKKKEIKKSFVEDEDLEEEIEKLCSIGLKNRAHTLNLSRLMVRSRESEHRNRLLKVIQDGEPACRRLFLDYHGLRLIWSYMMDVGNSETKQVQQFKLELLKTLNTLPIPNKTMLMDSKVYDVVEKWSNDSDDDANKSSSKNQNLPNNNIIDDNKQQNDDEIKKDNDENNCDNNEIINTDEKYNNQNDNSCKINNDDEEDNNIIKMIIELAKNILDKWSNLKEVFRIPKKERIEQMKEHEREADIGYREDSEKEDRRESYDRQRIDRYSSNRRDDLSITSSSSSSLLVLSSRDRRSINKGRDSPDLDTLYRNKQDNNKRPDERTNLVQVPRLTKYERRQLFALQVAKEEEQERQRRQQQHTWQEHESRCHALGIDPYTTPLADSQTGYPIFFDQLHGQWQSYPPPSSIQETPDMQIPHCNSMYMPPNSQPIQQQQQQQQQPPPMHSMIGPQLNSHQPGMPIEALGSTMSTPMYDINQQPPYQTQYSNSNLITLHSGTSSNININCVTPKTVPVQPAQHMYINPAQLEKPIANLTSLNVVDSCDNQVVEEEPTPEFIDLPPKWKSAKDARGRVYYYHVKERIPQWLPPPPTHIGLGTESSSSSESSEEESSSSDEDAEVGGNEPEDEGAMMDDDASSGVEESIKGIIRTDPRTACFVPEAKKRRNGLVEERIISPRREEDRVDRKKHKLLKEKLRRHKERGKHKSTKEDGEKVRKHRRSNKSKSHSKHTETKLQAIAQSNDLSAERKIKDMFRINMANVIVRFLNPHRQNDCKQGRITNTEDFKYLARKLTHFVLAKELKHCKSVDELQCNENVKHKAKDFVRKYMNKFGPVYQRSFDED